MLLMDLDSEYIQETLYRSGFKTSQVIEEWLNNAPTIDAVPVVRCRECKHLNVVNRKELYAHCPKTNTMFLPFELDTREHFCSLGEPKEGVDNG